MNRAATSSLLLKLALLLLITAPLLSQVSPTPATVAARANAGVQFTPNRGQIVDVDGKPRPEIRYISQSKGMSLYMSDNRISYVFSQTEGDLEHHRHADGHYDATNPAPILKMYRMDLEFVGASPSVEVTGDIAGSSYTNYYLPHIPNGLTHVPSFGRITYRNLYPNIDFVLRGSGGNLKYDFVVRPGGRVSDIRMRYVGATGREIDHEGKLVTTTPLGTLTEDAPYTFQETSSRIEADMEMPMERQSVGSRYRIVDGIISFMVDEYDARRTLVIDPTQKWSTFYGGNGNEDLLGGDATEVDRSGNCLFAGMTTGAFPTSTGAFQTAVVGAEDVMVVKMTITGARVWATLYGGSGQDLAHGIVTDNDRNVFIAGHSASNNFPTSTGAHQTAYGGNRDAFAVKFDSAGVRQWGTYYGGSQLDDSYGFAIDSTGNPAMVGTTGSTSGIATAGSFQSSYVGNSTANTDVFLVKFNTGGVRQWATYCGGTGEDFGYGAASDINNNINITGWTNSNNFPVTTGAFQTTRAGSYDAFVVRFNSAGSQLWGTYFGGTGNDNEQSPTGFSAIATDGEGNPMITGVTRSTNLPTSTSAIQGTFGGGTSDAYIAKFDTLGGRLWSTYYGGSSDDVGQGIASNISNGVLVTGHTTSTNFPGITTDAFATTKGTGSDAFIVKLNSTGTTRQYVTYYGGTGNDEGVGISFDPFGSIVIGGTTASNNFPTTAGAYQTTRGGGTTDAFLALFCDIEGSVIDTSGPTTFCRGESVTLFVPPGYTSYLWQSRTNASISTDNEYIAREEGDYWVRLTNGAGCVAYSDTIEVRFFPEPDPLILPSGTQTFCQGDSVVFVVESRPFATYEWYDATLTTRLDSTGRTYTVKQSGTFRVIVTDFTGCIDTSNAVTVVVNPKPAPVTITPPGPVVLCDGESITLTASPTTEGTVRWSNGRTGQSINVTTTGTYSARVVNAATGCSSVVSNEVRVRVNPLPRHTAIGLLPTTFCEGDSTIWSINPLTDRSELRSVEWNVEGISRGSGDTIHLHKTSTGTLTVVDTNGCQRVTPFNVTMITPPSPKLIPDETICEGDSVMLDAGGGYSSYLWSTGEQTQIIWAKNSGEYFVTVSDFSGAGCKGVSDTFELKVTPRPTIFLTGPGQVCAGSTSRYSVPDNGGITYTWRITGAGTAVAGGTPADTSVDVQWGAAGSGRVEVTAKYDTSDCPATAFIDVTIGTTVTPTIAAIPSDKICVGESTTLDAGTFATYRWTDAGGALLGSNRTLVVNTAGTYFVDVVDAGGCTGRASKTITIEPLPTPTITPSGKLALCPGESVTLDAGPHSSYRWSGGQITRTITVTTPGDYTVTVTNASGCEGTSTITTVTAIEPPAPTLSGLSQACLNATETYTVTNAVAGASSYAWSITPATAGTIVGPATGSSVQIQWTTQGNALVSVDETSLSTGCTGSSLPLAVTVSDKLAPEIISIEGTLFRLCDGGSMTLRAPGFNNYVWSDATGATLGTDDSLVVTKPGDYTVTVTQGSCSGTATVTVTLKPPVIPTVNPNGTAALCPGDSLVVTGEDGYASYQWTRDGVDLPGETERAIIVRVGGTYTVRVIDRSGCPGESGPIQLTVYPGATVPTISANGDQMTSTPATTYQWSRNGVEIAGATGQSYTAPGDGSYTVTITDANGCRATSEPYQPNAPALATVGLHQFSGTPGERITIPITLSRSENLLRNSVNSFTARIRFNRTLLLPTSPVLASTIDGDDRIITVTGELADNYGGDSISLALIDFTVALGNAISTPLELESFEWNKLGVATATFNGLFTVVGLCENGGTRLIDASGVTALKPARPNPTRGLTSIEYEVVEDGRTRLLLVDMLGRTIPIVDAEITAGRYVATFDASALPSGAYYCILETRTERLTQSVTIQK